MSTKMKGLFKGVRYISQIFEEQGEKELQIGLPTDVRHVAHIGWDGPSSSAPSWISQFKGEGDSSGAASPNVDMQNVPRVRDPWLPPQEKRVSTGSDSALESPLSRRRMDKPRGSRRQSLAGSSVESPRRSSTSESRVKSPPGLESPRDSTGSGSGSGSKNRKKKSKGLSGTSSKSSSKSKRVDQTAYGSEPGSTALKSKDKSQGSVHDL